MPKVLYGKLSSGKNEVEKLVTQLWRVFLTYSMFRQNFSLTSHVCFYILYIRRVMIFSWAHDVSTRVEIWTQAVALAETWQIAQNQRNILSNKRNIVSTSPLDATFSHGFNLKQEKSGTYKRYASIFCSFSRLMSDSGCSVPWYVCALPILFLFVIIGWSEVLCFRLFFSRRNRFFWEATLFLCWIK